MTKTIRKGVVFSTDMRFWHTHTSLTGRVCGLLPRLRGVALWQSITYDFGGNIS